MGISKFVSITSSVTDTTAALRCAPMQTIDSSMRERTACKCKKGAPSTVDGAPFLHLHAVLSRMDESIVCIGAHLKAAVVSVTLEVMLTNLEIPITRRYDESVGLNLLD